MKTGLDISVELRSWMEANRHSRIRASILLGVADASMRHWLEGRPCGMAGPLLKLMAALDRVSMWGDEE